MQRSEIYLALGQDNLNDVLRTIAIGKLRTYQLFEPLKVRLHVSKLNTETLKKIGPRLWDRLKDGDDTLAIELSQAILVSHLDMIVAVLDFLGVPHTEGFFEKESEIRQYLGEGWQRRAYDHFVSAYPPSLLLFYLNHLNHEVNPEEPPFLP